MSPSDELDGATAINDTGHAFQPRSPLSARILEAFYAAYEMGENDVANFLRSALSAHVNHSSAHIYGRPPLYKNLLGKAALWTAYVKACDEYRLLCEAGDPEAALIAEAREARDDAHRRWSID